MSKPVLLKGGLLVTMNTKREVFKGDILIEKNKIAKIAKNISHSEARVVDAKNQFVIPGLIQSHIHLCQTLGRGMADDTQLLDWLETCIWPMESRHSAKSIQASAKLSILEMQKAGTTTIMDMATVHHTNELLETVEESGLRYLGGKCMMDRKEHSGPLYETTKDSLKEAEDLIKSWHKKNELIDYALCPRFAVSCTEDLLLACGDLQKKYGVMIHTHAAENKDEIALVKKLTGYDNIAYFEKLNLLNDKMIIAHGVHVTDEEVEMLVQRKAKIVHCPSSNLKLASGIAPIESYRKRGICVGIGADGAPCNNCLDPFVEIRLAALLQKPLFGSEAMPAMSALEMATIDGARALGKEDEIGSLEVGKLADIVCVDRSHPSVCTVENPYSALVYSCSGRDVAHTFINGKQVVKNFKSTIYDEEKVKSDAIAHTKKLFKN
ncbi:MAG: 5'-deoxyadenosine deaminase [Bdellovibrionales bacterium]|nr:5'-deoxyadenosine deaminase [Bdellovibrionales bacterium]